MLAFEHLELLREERGGVFGSWYQLTEADDEKGEGGSDDENQEEADEETQQGEDDDGMPQQQAANKTDEHLNRDLFIVGYMFTDPVAYSAFMSGWWDNDTILDLLSVRNLGPRIVTTPMPEVLQVMRSRTECWTDKVLEQTIR
ncbi:hypothetical protein BST61_g1090 [Cercospora zeina]